MTSKTELRRETLINGHNFHLWEFLYGPSPMCNPQAMQTHTPIASGQIEITE